MSSWTYHAILTSDRDEVLEVGPFPTVEAALEFANTALGRTACYLALDVFEATVGNPGAPVADWPEDTTPGDDFRTLTGWRVERYDGQRTDPSWALHPTVAERAA